MNILSLWPSTKMGDQINFLLSFVRMNCAGF